MAGTKSFRAEDVRRKRAWQEQKASGQRMWERSGGGCKTKGGGEKVLRIIQKIQEGQ